MTERITSTTLRSPISQLEPREPVCVRADSVVKEAIRQMQANRIGCVLVCDGQKLVGIFTERDVVMRVLSKGLDVEATDIGEVMTGNPDCLRPEDTIAFALNRMSVGSFRHIPLTDGEGRAVGIISVKDVFGYLVKTTKST